MKPRLSLKRRFDTRLNENVKYLKQNVFLLLIFYIGWDLGRFLLLRSWPTVFEEESLLGALLIIFGFAVGIMSAIILTLLCIVEIFRRISQILKNINNWWVT